MRLLARVVFLAVVPVLAFACSSSEDGQTCTLLGCADEGVRVDFTVTETGAYAIEVVVDGTSTSCTATLPLAASDTGSACTSADVVLTRTGSALPASQQSIGGLLVRRTDAKSIAVRITRDGRALREATVSPTYTVTPGPNGAACEPKTCTSAAFTLP